MTARMKNIVMRVPQKMTAAIGIQRLLPPRSIGTTPIDAQADVRKIGRIRSFAASRIESRIDKPLVL